MTPIIALREKLLACLLTVVLLATLLVTQQQRAKDQYRNLGVLPRVPDARRLEQTFPVTPLALEVLQQTEDFGAYTPLIEQDPFVRVQTPNSAASPAAAPSPAEATLRFRGRVVLGGRQMAVIESTDAHETFFVGVGQEIQGLKVVDITEERVIVSKTPDQQITLRLADESRPRGR